MLLLLLSGCTCSEPPKAPAATLPVQKIMNKPQATAIRPQLLHALMQARDGGQESADAGGIAAPALNDLINYARFSSDSLAFAAALPTTVEGPLWKLAFYSATTSTIEKELPLDTDADRITAAKALADENFPPIGNLPPLPKEVGAKLVHGDVQLTFGGHAAGKLYKPFANAQSEGSKPVFQIMPTSATVVAVSADGNRAGVRIDVESKSSKSVAREFHVFTLFE